MNKKEIIIYYSFSFAKLVLFGWVTVIIPRVYTYWISTALFAAFGLKMLKEGYSMSPNEGQEEFEEVQSDLKKQEDEVISFEWFE